MQTTLRSGAITIAAVSAGAVLMTSGAAPAPGPGPGPTRPATITTAWTTAARPTADRPVAATRVSPLGTAHVRPGASSVNSLNSAGYAVSRARTRFRLVRATSFVPYLNCRLSPGSYSAGWVGLDGFVGTPDSAEQVGVAANCTARRRAKYHAWFAMYPHARTPLRVSVRAGDSVTASVYYDRSTAKFTLRLADNTTGGHAQVRAACPHGVRCPRDSAEIITSALTAGSGSRLTIRPLADYGAMSFTSIAITDRSGDKGSVRSRHWGSTRIVETQRAAPFRVIARPTLVHGTTFATYWSRAR
ncbi:MAG TPA: G1 family glutamic endopeptidase [Streptosporangiaceae bacterium]